MSPRGVKNDPKEDLTVKNGDGHEMMVLKGKEGNLVLSISRDGELILGEGITPREVAKQLFEWWLTFKAEHIPLESESEKPTNILLNEMYTALDLKFGSDPFPLIKELRSRPAAVPETEPDPSINTSNDWAIRPHDPKRVLVPRMIGGQLSNRDALLIAAWLVRSADPTYKEFASVLKAVRSAK